MYADADEEARAQIGELHGASVRLSNARAGDDGHPASLAAVGVIACIDALANI